MGRTWVSGGMWHGWVTKVYLHIKLQLSKSKRTNSLGFGWNRVRKSFWTSRTCWRIQCNRVCMTSWLRMEHCWKSESCGNIGCCTLHLYFNILISILSPWEFQLPNICIGQCFSAVMLFLVGFQLLTLCAGWFLSAIIFSLSPRSFQLPVCLSPTTTSFLSPWRFCFPSFTCFSAVKWLVFH